MRKRERVIQAALVAVVVAVGAAVATAGHDGDGFVTAQPKMLTGVMPGVQITPLLTVGDELPGGYTYESIPDGIALDPKGKDVDVWVNHETGRVPFPFSLAAPTSGNPGALNNENDFDNAQLSHLVLDKTGRVQSGEFAISSSAGYQRFCSNFLATKEQGFDRDILFTNEETPDYVARQAESWPPSPAAQKEAGVVIALDVKDGTYHPIYGMGRHNHENAVAIPGFKENVVLSGDDTFTSGPLTSVSPSAGDPDGMPVTGLGEVPGQSQLYSYIAKDTKTLLNDGGDLWAFVSDTPGVKNYYDVLPGSGTQVQGHFIKVPKMVATGLKPDGTEVKATDLGYPLPPTNGSWQTDLRSATPVGIDGPQWVLEYWSDLNNVFQFVRIEDIAYDRLHDNVVYVVDSGRGRTPTQLVDTPPFASTNGRVWKMVFDKKDPTVVTSLTVFVEGDDHAVKTLDEIHQPDNVETTKKGILLTEDPGSSQQFPSGSTDPSATTARLWYVPFDGTPAVVAKIDQSADGTAIDKGPAPGSNTLSIGNWGAWETTGIVDASKAFGKDMFLINVQAHTLWIDRARDLDNDAFAPIGTPDYTEKKEGGQLLLLNIPGAT